ENEQQLREQWQKLRSQHNGHAAAAKQQLDVQSRALKDLRAQRKEVNRQMRSEKTSSQDQNAQTSQMLLNKVNEVESQYQDEKAKLDRLNQSLSYRSTTQTKESAAITKYAAEKSEIEARVAGLKHELTEHEKRLKELME